MLFSTRNAETFKQCSRRIQCINALRKNGKKILLLLLYFRKAENEEKLDRIPRFIYIFTIPYREENLALSSLLFESSAREIFCWKVVEAFSSWRGGEGGGAAAATARVPF